MTRAIGSGGSAGSSPQSTSLFTALTRYLLLAAACTAAKWIDESRLRPDDRPGVGLVAAGSSLPL